MIYTTTNQPTNHLYLSIHPAIKKSVQEPSQSYHEETPILYLATGSYSVDRSAGRLRGPIE
jgi:hypothetical protein